MCIYCSLLAIIYFVCANKSFFHLLFQVKSYARVHGQTTENDRGYVSISYNEYVTESYKRSRLAIYAHIYRLIVLGAFIFINLLTPVALAKSASLYYPKITVKSGELLRFLYVATAIMAILCNALYIYYSIKHHIFHNKPAITTCIIPNNYKCEIPSDTDVYGDEIASLVTVLIVIPITVFLELVISIYTVKCNRISQKSPRYSHLWKQLALQILNVFTLWNIFMMFQLFAKVAIPICVLLLIHPQVTIFWFLVLLMVLLSSSLTITYLLYQCQQLSKTRNCCCNARHCGRKFLHFVVLIVTLGLILMLLGLYELLLIVQVQFQIGVKGIILSLLPSFPLSVLGWYIKRRSQMKAKKYLHDDGLQLLVEKQETANITDTSIDEEPLPL